MKITEKWLVDNQACSGGRDWWKGQTETNGVKVVEKLIAESKLDWANWLVVRLMGRENKIRYAIFAAEQVLDIFENRYPDDKRPRVEIEAARAALNGNPAKNTTSPCSADDTYSPCASARSSAHAAFLASTFVDPAAAATHAATYASYAADDDDAMKTRIIQYGIGLLKKGAK